MTREEAREELKEMIEYEWGTYFTNTAKKHVTALEMAIKELEQEPFMNKACVSSNVCKHDKAVALDKIRAEIKQLRNFRAENYDLEQYCACFDARIIFRDDVFEILDKYKTESEGEE